jgi:FlaA1/EpsC-like NDP-sugar epimerase
MLNKVILDIRDIPRLGKRILMMAFDTVALATALWASFSLRFGVWTPPTTLDQLVIILTAPIVAIPIFIRLGLYRSVIRFLPERALWTVLQGVTLATTCWVVVVFLSEMAGRGVVPRSVPVLYWIFSLIAIGGSRFLVKRLLWAAAGASLSNTPILIYGAGQAGAQLATAIQRDSARHVVAFIDDNPALHGRDVAAVRVHSPTEVHNLITQYGIQEIVLSIPSLPSSRRKEIVAQVGGLGVRVRTLPPISDLISGRYLISQIREIDIDELLGRSSVPADRSLLRQMIEGKIIMVTGAGGSIGSELCRLIVEWAPQRLVLFEANEFALYQIERELAAVKDRSIVPVLGSVTDDSNVRHTIASHQVEVVFHAAAHKHVPLVEANVIEGIRNNVFGTRTVVDAAYDLGVRSFVLISSDKAVRPTNVMGATKRWAELIVQKKAFDAGTGVGGQRFCAVRFGNVLGSNGSVVPLFKEQIAHGGPITLTDRHMTRYFMSIHEASELIIQAGSLSEGGDVFLLDMGEPVVINNLAENMIRLAGLTVRDEHNPDGDIQIVVTGKRPGEKLYEELFYDETTARKTKHPKILRATGDLGSGRPLDEALNDLASSLRQRDEARARSILFSQIRDGEVKGCEVP